VHPSLTSSRLLAGFAVLFAALLVTFVASVHGASRLPGLNAGVAHAREVLEEIRVTRSSLREADAARRGYRLTREGEFLELFLATTKDAVAHLDRLRALTDDDPAQRRRVDAMGPLVARQLALVTDAIAGSDRPAAPEAAAADGAIVGEQIRGLVAELHDDEEATLREREADANARTVKVIRGLGAVALVALLLLGGAYYVLDRDAAVHAAVVEELRRYTRPAVAVETSPSAPDGGTLADGERAPST
jgi:CHASE3 domain sensor protein